MYFFILTVITIICALLILVVLLQNGQGSGLSGIASGGGGAGLAGNSGLGARRTADLLSKSTSILGAAFLLLCILANFAIDTQGPATRSILQQQGVAPIENNTSNPSQTQSAVPQQTTPPSSSEDNN